MLELLSAIDPEVRSANREKVKALYGVAVEEFSEVWLPALLDAARADVVVLVSDHGESWGERLAPDRTLESVFDLHGNHLHDEVIRVPLVLHAPSLVAPVTVKGLARTVDIGPTLLEFLELEHADGERHRVPRAGRSLVPALGSGRVSHEALAFSARNRDFVDASELPADPAGVYVELSCRDLGTKIIADFGGESAREYDLIADPGELRPRALTPPPSSSRALAVRSEIEAAVVAPEDREGFARMREQLRRLGYL